MKTLHKRLGIGAALATAAVIALHGASKPVQTQSPHTAPAVTHTIIDQIADAKRDATKRSSEWPTFRKHNLAPQCAYCGRTTNLQLHHIEPFHLHPEKELDPTNVITLCETPGVDCHLIIGHLKNFRSDGNPNVVEDCRKHREAMQSSGNWPEGP